VLAGTLAGGLIGDRLPAGMRERVLAGLGLVTLALGIDDALHWRAHTYDPLYVLGGVLLGGIVGELLGIERRLQALGERLQRLTARDRASGHSTVAEAFFTASLLFCVGPLTVLGSIQDGLSGHYQTLVLKATLDGFAAIALAASLGWGVALAAGTVLVIQGGLSLGAQAFDTLLRGEVLEIITSAGGLLIVGISLRLLDIRDVRVGNYLPALVIAPGLYGVVSAFS
jgi:uncharacterized protein